MKHLFRDCLLSTFPRSLGNVTPDLDFPMINSNSDTSQTSLCQDVISEKSWVFKGCVSKAKTLTQACICACIYLK